MKHNFGFFIREGVGNMFSHGFMSFAAIGITVACLVIMGTFSLVAYNANENLKDLQRENAVLAFVDENLSDEEARGLQSQLEKLPNVTSCTFVSREEARDSYIEQYDEDDLYSDLDPQIFRHRYVLKLGNLEQMSQTVQAVQGVEGIVKIRADEDISNGFLTVRNIAGVISITLIAILLIVSVFIISNTIKLTTFDRRDEIAIMKMVGATNSFIRLPFVVEGLVLGLLGGGLAFLAEWGLYSLITSRVMGTVSNSILTESFISLIPFKTLALPVLIVFMAISVLVGVFGGVNAIRNYLKV
jgi:cell division transport system permease protein